MNDNTSSMPNGAEWCHALRAPLRTRREAERVVSRFRALAVDRGWRLWEDELPPSHDPFAARRRLEREMSRPLHEGDRGGLRATLLRRADREEADLVLVASRRLFDAAALSLVAQIVSEEIPASDFVVGTADAFGPWNGTAPRPDWGLAGALPAQGIGRLAGHGLLREVDCALVAAAIGIVLGRYEPEAVPALGFVGDRHTPPRLLEWTINAETTVSGLLASITDRLSAPRLREEPCAPPAVGLLWESAPGWPGSRDIDYMSCLAPLFPLTVVARSQAGGTARLSYVFDRATFGEQVLTAFDRAVTTTCGALQAALSSGRDVRIAGVEHVDPAVACEWGAVGSSNPLLPAEESGLRIDERIAGMASRHPQAAAVTYQDRHLSYGELHQAARRMAAALRKLGVRPGDRIGVCMERSLELVPSLLAVLRSGAAYVPLDPAYPAERLAYTLRDAQPSLVIGADGCVPAEAGIRTVSPQRLEELAADLPPEVDTDDREGEDAASAAYVIYTSGSTGHPKGVVVPHLNVAALVDSTREEFGLGPADTWTLFHSTAFDFSVWEIWACLMTGGRLVVVPHAVTRAPDDFLQLIAREHVTVLNQTPSAFAQLDEAERQHPTALALRLVIFGGEGLDCRMLLGWFDRHPESACRLVNMFGITETTVHVTMETIRRRHALVNSRVVGRPLRGWHVYVMDPSGRLLPPGVAGEIFVGGAGVAHGYLNRDALTAERFLEDPVNGGRMYRSGDRGRLLLDGRLEHLGRLDSQVKIRGFRIELGEIRAVLLACPGVASAAVVVRRGREDDPASARIDAYVTPADVGIAELRTRCARFLPEHMLPATITALEALPLTANGKLDATRLPPPQLSTAAGAAGVQATQHARDDRPLLAEGSAASATPGADAGLIEALQRIWGDVLGVNVGLDDNFFELGGNSLYAVRIASAMRSEGLRSIPLRELYVRQSIRGLSELLLT